MGDVTEAPEVAERVWAAETVGAFAPAVADGGAAGVKLDVGRCAKSPAPLAPAALSPAAPPPEPPPPPPPPASVVGGVAGAGGAEVPPVSAFTSFGFGWPKGSTNGSASGLPPSVTKNCWP